MHVIINQVEVIFEHTLITTLLESPRSKGNPGVIGLGKIQAQMGPVQIIHPGKPRKSQEVIQRNIGDMDGSLKETLLPQTLVLIVTPCHLSLRA